MHKKVEEAVEYLRKSVRINPKYPPFKITLASNLLIIKKVEKALEELEYVLSVDRNHFDANYVAG